MDKVKKWSSSVDQDPRLFPYQLQYEVFLYLLVPGPGQSQLLLCMWEQHSTSSLNILLEAERVDLNP